MKLRPNPSLKFHRHQKYSSFVVIHNPKPNLLDSSPLITTNNSNLQKLPLKGFVLVCSELERKCLRSTDREEGKKRCCLQERSRNAGCARRQCTLLSFSQLMVSLFTSLASSVLTANPPFNYCIQKMLRRESSNKQSGGHSLVLMLLVGLLACVNIGYILNGRT